ncbi:probable G-protein coupled receptor 179 [Ochotona curzoniae]|uniref:probable G-protein coupled receptor 179 n=1 Tax=Ochotona curzoniae TaxID=130825 RepID=UPI001B34AF4C|nr:probable G-protein coupled receptor 179 [Ochotona curzoniae]
MGTRALALPTPVRGLLGCCFLCSWALGGPRPFRSLLSPIEPESRPVWLPLEEAEAALAFLYSGDARQLLGANCSERYTAGSVGARAGLPLVLQGAASTLAQAANFLNMLLQANDIRESSVEEDVEWYQALVRSMAEGDPRAYRALLTFDPPPGASHRQLALQATRMGEETILQDLFGNRMHGSPAEDPDTPTLQKRVLTNDLGSLGSPKWPRGDGYVGDIQQVRLSPPFLECQEGQFRPGWLVTLSATFYGLKPDLSPEVRGQVQMDIDLQRVDIDQCASSPGWYANTHLCDLNSTQCVPLANQGFVLGRYLCRCLPGFYGASRATGLEENATHTAGQFESPRGNTGRLLRCQPCPEGCPSCQDATPCLVEEAPALRAAVLACQACCMLAVFLSMLISYHRRWSKSIRASGVVLLETILFGSLLLYFPVFILYFKASVFRCIVLRWVRLLGFATMYGTIILKLYRILQLFLSRTAQRGPHLSSGQLLRRLGLLLLLVLGFLAVWTEGVLERDPQHTPLVTQGHTPTGRHFYLCHHDHWDYIMVVAELLLLCWGSFLCYATRAVPSAFHEPRYLGFALHNELLLSTAFHMARFMLVPSLHPDWTLLLFFFHTHSTVTATLALIFIPKFWKPGAPPREEILEEVYEDELDLQRSGSYLDSSIASAWSERSLDPGDIRDELKKLYAQLEVHKTKEMAANNPHLPKKQGSSRQGLGRSFIRYLAEFPEALARQHSRDAGSLGHGSLPSSSRCRLLSTSFQESEGPPAHDQPREQDSPLLDSLLRRTLSKKAPRVESRERAEGPPALSFRSASAHNLTVGEHLPRARPPSLQKSLSVVAGSREKALLVASQAYLEETYRQAKEQEERRKAEVALVSPARRPSARRLERVRGAPLSAPPSPAKSRSMDSSRASGKLHEEAGRRLAHPPIRHQVSTPIMALSGAFLGESRMLSPTSTLAPAPVPTLAPAPALMLAPAPPQSPTLLNFICPWENAELPVKKEPVAQEAPMGPEQGSHSPAPARARLWRALSVAVEKRGAGENGLDLGNGPLQEEAAEAEEDRPKLFSKSHSLRAPVEQGSMRSLGLAIKALTRSRSTYREKESKQEGPEQEKAKVPGQGGGVPPRSPRPGRPPAVSKQAALTPCDDEESMQNQQNTYTSRMLQVHHWECSGKQEDRGLKVAQGNLGEQRAERAGKVGPAILKQVCGDRNVEQAREAPVGGQEAPRAGLQLLGSADHRMAEVCPWEVTGSQTAQLDGCNKVEICPWEVSKGAPEGRASQYFSDSQDERHKASEKTEPRGGVATAQKMPERLVRGQEAVCPWETAEPGGASPQSFPVDTERRMDTSEAVGSGQARKAGDRHRGDATDPKADTAGLAAAELGPWQAGGEGEGKTAQGLMQKPPQERQKSPKRAAFWKERNLGTDLEAFCPCESTDFRGPLAVSLQVSGGCGAEMQPREAGDVPAFREAEVCPWELGAEGRRTGGACLLKGKAAGKGSLGEAGEQAVNAVQAFSAQQESPCPWDSTDNSSRTVGAQLPSSAGSGTVQVHPREDLELEFREATSAKAEICPWEVEERTEGRTSGRTPRRQSLKDEEKTPGKAGSKGAGAQEKSEEQTQKREAVCPWEGVDSSSCGPQLGPPDSDRTQVVFQASSSVRSKAAEICPWDVQGTPAAARAESCPWEATGAAASEESTQGMEATRKSPTDSGETPEDSRSRESVVTVPKKPEPTGREVACPWESLGPGGQHADSLDTDRPKVGFQASDHVGCRPAEVCPWEVEETPTSEKAKICPWEVNEGATGKELEQKKESDSAGQREKTLEDFRFTSLGKGESKPEAKWSHEQEAICPWEDKTPKEASSQAKVSDPYSRKGSQVAEGHSLEVSCEATENRDLRQDPKTHHLQEHRTQSTALTPEGRERSSTVLQSVSPPLLVGPDQRLARARDRATDICPWEAPELDTPCVADLCAKAEICPWEGAETLPKRTLPTQDGPRCSQEKGKAAEKPEPQGMEVQSKLGMANSGQQGAVRPQESPCRTGLSLQSGPLASDGSHGGSEAAGSVGVRAAEVCPWETEEPSCAKRAEICPWEAREGAAKEGELGTAKEGDGDTPGQRLPFQQVAPELGGEQEAVCPWEDSTARGILPQPEVLDPVQVQVSPQAAGSVGSRMAELCRWEVTDPDGNKIKGTMADICPWEETGHLALTPTQTENSPPVSEQSLCLSVHEPLRSFLPESKSPWPQVNKPASTSILEGIKETQGPSGLGPRIGLVPEPHLQEVEPRKSISLSEDEGQVAADVDSEDLAPARVYPWDEE